jgi:hypothetical protein
MASLGAQAMAAFANDQDDSEAQKKKREERANRTIILKNGVRQNNYCACRIPGCRRPAPLVANSEYCMEHHKIGLRIQRGSIDINSLERFVPRMGRDGTDKFVALEAADRKKKDKSKGNKKAYLAKMAYESGDPKEFMRMRVLERLQRGGRAGRLFAEIDKDLSGYVDFGELKTALRRKGCKLTDAEVSHMMVLADTDGDGVISLAEFEVFLTESFDGASGFGDKVTKKNKKTKGKGSRRKSELYDLKNLGKEFAKKAQKEREREASRSKGSKKQKKSLFPSLSPANRPLPTLGLFDQG